MDVESESFKVWEGERGRHRERVESVFASVGGRERRTERGGRYYMC